MGLIHRKQEISVALTFLRAQFPIACLANAKLNDMRYPLG
eukprot:CAMPEP_0204496038 /NCGR_PEP_ID=MMETSP0471-20130131/87840_1 /ASSEMBLY_ACC=CAM_ASM_000602 /TAXON_ID=2969 /ORGANISM="Oxyrrhis marina" /LENGTH=39 /DNA_ID= /DNA_START= /DNA_END= /DNA_ORIENTATION=